MIRKMNVEKSTVINFKNSPIAVISLPESIQNEIATFDRINQDKVDAMYELEKLELASYAKLTHINNLLEKHFENNDNGTKSVTENAAKSNNE